MNHKILLLFLVGFASIIFASQNMNAALGQSADILNRVMQEQIMAKQYSSLMMRINEATHGIRSGEMISQLVQVRLDPKSSESNVGVLKLQTVYSNWYHNKYCTYKAILSVEDLQRDFFTDRAIQLKIQSLGNQAPPQLFQISYMKFFGSYLKTLQISYLFQTLSHFRTWLEDAFDVSTASVDNTDYNAFLQQHQELPIIDDKLWAMSSYSTLAKIDMILFYVQYYTDYMTMALSGQSMGVQIWGKMMELYKLSYSQSSAQYGLQSAILEKSSYLKLHDNLEENDQQGFDDQSNALKMFSMFGYTKSISYKIEYMSVMYQMYITYIGSYFQAQAQTQTQTQAQQTQAQQTQAQQTQSQQTQ